MLPVYVTVNCSSCQLWMEQTKSTITAVTVVFSFQERALNACKGSERYTLQRGTCNSQVSSWHRVFRVLQQLLISPDSPETVQCKHLGKMFLTRITPSNKPHCFTLFQAAHSDLALAKTTQNLSRFVLNLSFLEKGFGIKVSKKITLLYFGLFQIISPQKDNCLISKKIPLIVPSLSTVLLDSSANTAGRDNIEMGVSNTTPQNATATKGHHLELYSVPAVIRKGQVLLVVLYRNVFFSCKIVTSQSKAVLSADFIWNIIGSSLQETRDTTKLSTYIYRSNKQKNFAIFF